MTTKKMFTLSRAMLIDGRRPIVLVDMDGVIADWQAMFDLQLAKTLPHVTPIPFSKITSFKTQKFYPQEHQADIQAMLNTPGYYRDLLPIEGGVEALHALAEHCDVFLCTAPFTSHTTCASEKMEWVREHLGEKWTERMVITSDKTLVFGDVLVDDKPNIKGVVTPAWKHIVFDAPYNQDHEVRIVHWSSGLEVIENVLAEIAGSDSAG